MFIFCKDLRFFYGISRCLLYNPAVLKFKVVVHAGRDLLSKYSVVLFGCVASSGWDSSPRSSFDPTAAVRTRFTLHVCTPWSPVRVRSTAIRPPGCSPGLFWCNHVNVTSKILSSKTIRLCESHRMQKRANVWFNPTPPRSLRNIEPKSSWRVEHGVHGERPFSTRVCRFLCRKMSWNHFSSWRPCLLERMLWDSMRLEVTNLWRSIPNVDILPRLSCVKYTRDPWHADNTPSISLIPPFTASQSDN